MSLFWAKESVCYHLIMVWIWNNNYRIPTKEKGIDDDSIPRLWKDALPFTLFCRKFHVVLLPFNNLYYGINTNCYDVCNVR